MTAISNPAAGPASATDRFVRKDVSGLVQSVTDQLTGIWPMTRGTPGPRNAHVASVRSKIMLGRVEPIRPCLTLVLAAIDEGKSWQVATAWAQSIIDTAKARAKANDEPGVRVLPFPDLHPRLVVHTIRENAEADCATATVDLTNLASVERAQRERLDDAAAATKLADFYGRVAAELRAQG